MRLGERRVVVVVAVVGVGEGRHWAAVADVGEDKAGLLVVVGIDVVAVAAVEEGGRARVGGEA